MLTLGTSASISSSPRASRATMPKNMVARQSQTSNCALSLLLALGYRSVPSYSIPRLVRFFRLRKTWVILLFGCVLGCAERDARLALQDTPELEHVSHAGIDHPNMSGMHLQLAVDYQSAWSWPCRIEGTGTPVRLRVPVQVIRHGRWKLSLVEPDSVDGLPGRIISQQSGALAKPGRSIVWQTLTAEFKGDIALNPSTRCLLSVEGATILRLAAQSEPTGEPAEGVYQSTSKSGTRWIQWPLTIAHEFDFNPRH